MATKGKRMADEPQRHSRDKAIKNNRSYENNNEDKTTIKPEDYKYGAYERQKERDKYIVKSWYVNNANNTVQTTQQMKEKENINRYNKRFDPFMFDYKKQERMRMAACIMLGGFKVKCGIFV